ncbi:MAG: ChbG/HpnK family deacetylase, partial [Actinobacteria bacterium]|nr:ChbG/HpnK family deacetylase [Actinomycetota bacterium]
MGTKPQLIITADDLGYAHGNNEAISNALAAGGISSASLMVPAPWAREFASRYADQDIGVH